MGTVSPTAVANAQSHQSINTAKLVASNQFLDSDNTLGQGSRIPEPSVTAQNLMQIIDKPSNISPFNSDAKLMTHVHVESSTSAHLFDQSKIPSIPSGRVDA